MRTALLIGIIGSMAFSSLRGQGDEIYSRLSMPVLERTLSLYKGQLQINMDYQHALGTSKFNSDGTRLSFDETASNFLANDLNFHLAYGINDFLEFSASMEMINQVETLPTVMFWDGEIFNEVNVNRQIQGPDHLDLRFSFRQPFLQQDFDFRLWAGISLPVTSQYPAIPSHHITLIDPADPNGMFILNYNYKFRPGSNASKFKFGLDSKIKVNRFGLFISGTYAQPFGQEQTYRWNHMLDGDQFTYLASSYEKLPGKELQLCLSPVYQLYSWFAIQVGLTHESEFGGWTEETGIRVALPKRMLGLISAGFEIMVSPAVRFVQHFNVPLYGKENYVLFSIRSGISINLIPLKRYYR